MFNLADYEQAIKSIATANKVSSAEAVNKFIHNLIIMRPRYLGAEDSVDFRVLGQRWNSLPSDVRNKQKRELIEKLSRTGRRSMED